MQRAKREDAKENIPSVASPNECMQAAPGLQSADTRAHECPCMHRAVPEFILSCLKQQIMLLSTVLAVGFTAGPSDPAGYSQFSLLSIAWEMYLNSLLPSRAKINIRMWTLVGFYLALFRVTTSLLVNTSGSLLN